MVKKVLVVDDDADILALVQLVLADEGYEVSIARDGREALVRLKADDPHLVLLDLAMPEMSGPEFLDAVMKWQPLPKTAVVIMTASPHAEAYARRPLVAGTLAKPFDLDDLTRCAARYLGLAAVPVAK